VLSYLERPHALNAAGGTNAASASMTAATSDSKTNGSRSTTATTDEQCSSRAIIRSDRVSV
jgi:hypothetical protein